MEFPGTGCRGPDSTRKGGNATPQGIWTWAASALSSPQAPAGSHTTQSGPFQVTPSLSLPQALFTAPPSGSLCSGLRMTGPFFSSGSQLSFHLLGEGFPDLTTLHCITVLFCLEPLPTRTSPCSWTGLLARCPAAPLEWSPREPACVCPLPPPPPRGLVPDLRKACSLIWAAGVLRSTGEMVPPIWGD